MFTYQVTSRSGIGQAASLLSIPSVSCTSVSNTFRKKIIQIRTHGDRQRYSSSHFEKKIVAAYRIQTVLTVTFHFWTIQLPALSCRLVTFWPAATLLPQAKRLGESKSNGDFQEYTMNKGNRKKRFTPKKYTYVHVCSQAYLVPFCYPTTQTQDPFFNIPLPKEKWNHAKSVIETNKVFW